jgi:CMP-N-acetylneuraminic acid synthetase
LNLTTNIEKTRKSGKSMIEKVTALLPMKGHSERVPNKNLRDFLGRPLYHHIAESLLGSRSVDWIIIDTDSRQIAEDAKGNFDRVVIVDRPEEICGDMVEMNAVIDYDLSQIGGEHFLQTHSTNPLLTAETIDRAVECYFKNLDNYDSLFSVNRLQTRLYHKDGSPINHDPKELKRTQDLPSVYEENSNIYIFSRSSFEEAGKRRIGKRPYMFEMDQIEAIDIDVMNDFELAKALYLLREGGRLTR